jgi:acetyl esterase/lipase
VATVFLVLSGIGFALTANARFPRHPGGVLAIPSFFAAWPVSELAPQVLIVQIAGAGLFVAGGALDSTAGVVALVLAAVSWTGLVSLSREAARSGAVVERALALGLGADYGNAIGPVRDGTAQRAISLLRLALALPLPDRRIEVLRNVRYADGAGRRHLLDVYRPAVPVTGAPVLVQIHGGAWIIGEKRQQGRPLMYELAAHGWVCVAPNYQLSPRVLFPEHLVDVKRALRWVREEVAGYGGDPDFVVVTGGSAGGHLAALAALTPNDPEYQPGFEDVDTSVTACVPFYAPYDLTRRFAGRGADGFGGLLERMVVGQRLAEAPDVYARASPIERIGPEAPPFMVVHGTADSLVSVEAARAFAVELREVSSQPVVFVELPGAEHAFEVFHSVRSDTVVRGVHRFLASVEARERRDLRPW